jgi:tetratricopeptide (TPR) repeat protein
MIRVLLRYIFQNSAILSIILLLGKDSTILVTPYLGMAKALGSIGKATKAIEIYQQVITLLESSKGAESKHLVVPLLSLGNLLLKEGRVNDAESHFTR